MSPRPLPDTAPDYRRYPRRATGSALSTAPPAAVWREVAAIGGANRYYYLNALWTAREVMDWAVGGPGRDHGRPPSLDLRVGDRIDSWTVLAVEPERRLALHFGMKAPGDGVLEFLISPLPAGGCRVAATAYWRPRGLAGRLYWLSLEPAHGVIFKGLTRAIAARAEGVDRPGGDGG